MYADDNYKYIAPDILSVSSEIHSNTAIDPAIKVTNYEFDRIWNGPAVTPIESAIKVTNYEFDRIWNGPVVTPIESGIMSDLSRVPLIIPNKDIGDTDDIGDRSNIPIGNSDVSGDVPLIEFPNMPSMETPIEFPNIPSTETLIEFPNMPSTEIPIEFPNIPTTETLIEFPSVPTTPIGRKPKQREML